MLIDDDECMVDLLKREFKKYPEIDVLIEWHEDLEPNIHFDHDVYIIDNRIRGIQKCLEIISLIREQVNNSHIFVMSGHTDFELLKKLFKLNIDGFIDKDSLDISGVIELINYQKSKNDRLNVLASKLEKATVGLEALGFISIA